MFELRPFQMHIFFTMAEMSLPLFFFLSIFRSFFFNFFLSFLLYIKSGVFGERSASFKISDIKNNALYLFALRDNWKISEIQIAFSSIILLFFVSLVRIGISSTRSFCGIYHHFSTLFLFESLVRSLWNQTFYSPLYEHPDLIAQSSDFYCIART